MKKITLFIAMLLFTAFNYSAQAQESHTVACTAGNLATLAAGFKATVTDLTVTGTIDARDFKTMRDLMPLLAVIDLSGSTVSAYTGTEGTVLTALTVYPANGIPINAFRNSLNTEGKTSLKSFIYPSSIITIGHSAFYGCYGLTGSLTIPSSVTTIGYSAFNDCVGFTGSLTLPSTVISIGVSAFSDCGGFTGPLTLPSSVTTIGANAFGTCRGFTGSLIIPSSVTSIGERAFWYCSGLTGSLIIPSSVTTIGPNAFDTCTGFTGSLTISSSVTTIVEGAFLYCPGFTGSLTIPSSVTSIGVWSFAYCSGLKGSLIIPSSVTTIGANAFAYCNGLTSIYTSSTTPIDISASFDVFLDVNTATCVLHVPVGTKAKYAAADQWKDFINIVEDIVPTSIEEVSSNSNSNFNSITIFPNPATSSITVSELSSFAIDKIVTLSVTDVSGSTLFTQEVEPSINTLTIDISSFKSGIYFIAIQTSNSRVVERFVKE